MTELPPTGLDLRLAIAAIAAWCAVLWGLGQSSGHVVVVAAAAFALAIPSALARRWRGGFHILALALCTVTVVLAPLAARLHRAHDGELSALAASRTQVMADLVVTADPRPLAAKGAGGSPRTAVEARITAVNIAGHRTSVSADVLVLGPADAWRAILPGQRVRLDARMAPPLPDDLLTATLSARTDPELLGDPPWWQRAAGSVRAGLQRASSGLPTLPRGLLPGLVDGDTSQLDPVLAERFRSGSVTPFKRPRKSFEAAALILKRMRASPRVTAVAGAIVLVGFVVIARPSPSVLRAAGMAAIALSALASGRQRSALPVLAASVIGLFLWKPMLAADVGFMLSVAATAALFLIAPGWAEALRRRRVPAGVAEAIAVAAAAHLVTAPIIVGISGAISLVAIPANLLAEPVVAALGGWSWADEVLVAEIDPELTDTAAFCQAYQVGSVPPGRKNQAGSIFRNSAQHLASLDLGCCSVRYRIPGPLDAKTPACVLDRARQMDRNKRGVLRWSQALRNWIRTFRPRPCWVI